MLPEIQDHRRRDSRGWKAEFFALCQGFREAPSRWRQGQMAQNDSDQSESFQSLIINAGAISGKFIPYALLDKTSPNHYGINLVTQ
jgi:hypothetical protein